MCVRVCTRKSAEPALVPDRCLERKLQGKLLPSKLEKAVDKTQEQKPAARASTGRTLKF